MGAYVLRRSKLALIYETFLNVTENLMSFMNVIFFNIDAKKSMSKKKLTTE